MIGRGRNREQQESDLVAARIDELVVENPLEGNPFDLDRLKAVHAYIFQDLPHHQPGVTRSDTSDWVKHRELEGKGYHHFVRYQSQDIEAGIADTLDHFGGPEAIRGLPVEQAAKQLAGLYAGLDHAHGFFEGNSRTLREFTRELAAEAGLNLDWKRTGVGAEERNELYLARDLAVLERRFPGLTPERAMQTDDKEEYEASYGLEKLRQAVGDRSLEAIIRDGLSRDRQHEQGAAAEPARARGGKNPAEVLDAGLAPEETREARKIEKRESEERKAAEDTGHEWGPVRDPDRTRGGGGRKRGR